MEQSNEFASDVLVSQQSDEEVIDIPDGSDDALTEGHPTDEQLAEEAQWDKLEKSAVAGEQANGEPNNPGCQNNTGGIAICTYDAISELLVYVVCEVGNTPKHVGKKLVLLCAFEDMVMRAIQFVLDGFIPAIQYYYIDRNTSVDDTQDNIETFAEEDSFNLLVINNCSLAQVGLEPSGHVVIYAQVRPDLFAEIQRWSGMNEVSVWMRSGLRENVANCAKIKELLMIDPPTDEIILEPLNQEQLELRRAEDLGPIKVLVDFDEDLAEFERKVGVARLQVEQILQGRR